MRLRYQVQCQECGYYLGPVWLKRRANRKADRHVDAHELALMNPSF